MHFIHPSLNDKHQKKRKYPFSEGQRGKKISKMRIQLQFLASFALLITIRVVLEIAPLFHVDALQMHMQKNKPSQHHM